MLGPRGGIYKRAEALSEPHDRLLCHGICSKATVTAALLSQPRVGIDEALGPCSARRSVPVRVHYLVLQSVPVIYRPAVGCRSVPVRVHYLVLQSVPVIYGPAAGCRSVPVRVHLVLRFGCVA